MLELPKKFPKGFSNDMVSSIYWPLSYKHNGPPLCTCTPKSKSCLYVIREQFGVNFQDP